MERTCKRCDRMLPPQARICACGYPTELASFKERTEHEVREWRRLKQQPLKTG